MFDLPRFGGVVLTAERRPEMKRLWKTLLIDVIFVVSAIVTLVLAIVMLAS